MKMYEDFARCPKCEQPYFRKNEYATLDKYSVESASPYKPVKELELTTEYICMKCAHILHTYAERKD